MFIVYLSSDTAARSQHIGIRTICEPHACSYGTTKNESDTAVKSYRESDIPMKK